MSGDEPLTAAALKAKKKKAAPTQATVARMMGVVRRGSLVGNISLYNSESAGNIKAQDTADDAKGAAAEEPAKPAAEEKPAEAPKAKPPPPPGPPPGPLSTVYVSCSGCKAVLQVRVRPGTHVVVCAACKKASKFTTDGPVTKKTIAPPQQPAE